MNIRCENPVIIQNPYLKILVCKYQVVHLGERGDIDLRLSRGKSGAVRSMRLRVQWDDKVCKLFWKTHTGVTPDTVDDFYVIDPESGETFPIYLVVPCGKCLLCKEKKARQWQTRCLAETAKSDYPPIFITLTYDNNHLPAEGVNKPDVQKFMKRLRKKLGKDGFDNKLRYVLVAEYGKNTHRAHYHMLLWNMPFISNTGMASWQALKEYIESSWQNGWIGMEQCKDASGKYCMKYIRKECVVPEGSNSTFMLASRKRGIGYAFAADFTEYARNNVNITSLSILNKFDGSLTNCSIPDYFKRLWYPSLSGIVKQEVRDDVAAFMEKARGVAYLVTKVPDPFIQEEVCDAFDYVKEKYCFAPEDFESFLPDHLFQMEANYHIREWKRYDPFLDRSDGFWHTEWVTTLLGQFRTLYGNLRHYKVDTAAVLHLLWIHDLHSQELRKCALACDPVNISDEVARVERENERLQRAMRPDD